MAFNESWRLVDQFKVVQAGYLWNGYEPPNDSITERLKQPRPAEVAAIIQALLGAVNLGTLKARFENNMRPLMDHEFSTLIDRDELKRFSEFKKVYPAFLFDTVAGSTTAEGTSPEPQKTSSSANSATDIDDEDAIKRGRPAEHDWDSMYGEIVRIADMDGLPGTQGELKDILLVWFSENYGIEPGESTIRRRLKPIYEHLKKVSWEPRG